MTQKTSAVQDELLRRLSDRQAPSSIENKFIEALVVELASRTALHIKAAVSPLRDRIEQLERRIRELEPGR